MSAAPQLADLLTVPDQDTVLNQEVFPELKKRNVRVTDWLTGGVYLAMSYVVALMRVSVRLAIAAFVAAGFEDYAFGFSTPPPNSDGSIIDVTGWAPIIAQQRYGLTQILASYTLRNITLTNAVNASYGPIQPGDFKISFPSGNRYVNNEAFTIPSSSSGGVVMVSFRSELTTNSLKGIVYNDPSNSAIALVTSNYPGVTASNPSTPYSKVSQAGSGLGTVTTTGTPTGGSHNVAVRIDASGTVAGATFRWSTQVDTLGWVTQTGSSATNLGGFGINLTLFDNGGNPSFVAGAVYYFNTPGSDITQAGADIETPQQLGTRCRGLIPALAFAKDGNGNWIPGSPTNDAYTTLILNANSQVRIVFISPSATVNNELNIVIAGQGGAPLSSGVVANVQDFLDSFDFLTDLPVITTSTARAISLAGLNIICKSAQYASAKAAMTLRLQQYLGGVDQATLLSINGLIDYDYIIALVRTTPGVIKVSGTLTINGVADDLQLPVIPGAFESASWTEAVTTGFTFSTAS
jgi:hypothetical protein